MKYRLITAILICMISNTALGLSKRVIYVEKKKTAVAFGGGSTKINTGENLLSFHGEFRHGISNYVGFFSLIESWSKGKKSTFDYIMTSNISFGFVFSFGGRMIPTQKYYELKTRRIKKRFKNRVIFTQKTVVKKKILTLSDLKFEVHLDQMSFSNISASRVVGFGLGAYYEIPVQGPYSLRLGVKYDKVNNQEVDVNVVQGYVGVIFYP